MLTSQKMMKSIVMRGVYLIHFILMTAVMSTVWLTIYAPSLEAQHVQTVYTAVFLCYLILSIFFYRTYNAYKIGMYRAGETFYSQTLANLFSSAITYLFACLIRLRLLPVWPVLAAFCGQTIVSAAWCLWANKLYFRLYPPRKMIVIYGEHSPDELIKKINSRRDKYDVCATASAYMGYEALYTKILEYEAVVLCDLPTEIRNKILKFCYDQNKRTYITPKVSDIIITGTERLHLFDTPLMLSRNQGLTIEQRFIKRTMDILFSLAAIVLTSPILVLIAIAIKCYDRGPVFYTQERLTRDREPFQIIKFRSMKVDSEATGAQLAKKDDDRITPVGKFIRRTHLDELPQIFNILKGDMSFVGPRPERQVIAEKYEEVVPEFRFRLKVKAGLTGYAQVYGKYNTTPYDKLKLDLTYIENYSAWLDLKLMLMTVKVIFQKENTEGVEKEQVTAIK